MQTKDVVSGEKLSIEIGGHITGLGEFTQLKSIINSHSQAKVIELNIKDAFVIPSVLIGYLVKLIHVDKKTIIMKCAKEELKTLITDLNLNTVITLR